MIALIIALAVVGYSTLAGALYAHPPRYIHTDDRGLPRGEDQATWTLVSWCWPLWLVYQALMGPAKLATQLIQARRARKALPEARVVER